MKRIEAVESTGIVTAVGSFIIARQIEMGEFRYLSGNLQAFFIIAAVSAAVVGASELIRRREDRSFRK